MATVTNIGLIGDRSDAVIAHRAIPLALEAAAHEISVDVRPEWVPSEEVASVERIAGYNGLWCVPGSPYRSMEGVLLAIRFAREHGRPFLGTCGGFQHAVIEYARNVLEWRDADHAESSPDAERAVISALICGLLNDFGSVRPIEGTRLARAYKRVHTEEEYTCRFGVNPEFRAALVSGPLRESSERRSAGGRARRSSVLRRDVVPARARRAAWQDPAARRRISESVHLSDCTGAQSRAAGERDGRCNPMLSEPAPPPRAARACPRAARA